MPKPRRRCGHSLRAPRPRHRLVRYGSYASCAQVTAGMVNERLRSGRRPPDRRFWRVWRGPFRSSAAAPWLPGRGAYRTGRPREHGWASRLPLLPGHMYPVAAVLLGAVERAIGARDQGAKYRSPARPTRRRRCCTWRR